MSTFEELHGITFNDEDPENSVTKMVVEESHLNWLGRAFGGCFMFVAGSSAQHHLGGNYAGNSYVFKFLSKVDVGEVLTGRTKSIKVGARSATTETQLCVGDELVGVMYADYYKRCETLPFTIDADFLNAKRPTCDYVINSEDDPHFAHDLAAFRHMFCFSGEFKKGRLKDIRQHASVGFFTDESFADDTGYINPVILGAPADIISGVLWRFEEGACVTTDISLKICASIKSGAFITCSAEILERTGSLMLARGLFWADDTCIGSYSATFMKVSLENLPSV